MAGAVNDYLIYPIIELIRREIDKLKWIQDKDPFAGIPEVELYRDHPRDPDRVTGARLDYESGYSLNVYLTLGSTDLSTFPEGVDKDHYDYEYYTTWRLTKVGAQALDPFGKPIANTMIRLNYDSKGRLTSTSVDRM